MLLDCVFYVRYRLEIRKCFPLKISLLLCLLSVNSFSLAKLHDSISMNKIGNDNDVLSFPSWDTPSIGEQFASLILDIVDVLSSW